MTRRATRAHARSHGRRATRARDARRACAVVVVPERRARGVRKACGVSDERDIAFNEHDEYEYEYEYDDDDEYGDAGRAIGALFVVFSFHVARSREWRERRARGVRVRRVRETDDAVRSETLQRDGARRRWMGRCEVFSVCGDISELAHDERGGD